MKRSGFFALSLLSFGIAAVAKTAAQVDAPAVRSSQDVAPELIQARAQAEKDLKQVHALAQYQATLKSSGPRLDLANIDSQYDDLVASVNGYCQGFAAAVELPGPLDDAKWKSKGNDVIAQATSFDDAIKKLRAANGTSSSTRVFPLAAIASILTQIVLPGASGYLKVKTDAESGNAAQRKQIADVFITAQWRESALVLAPARAQAAASAPPSPAPEPAASPK